MNFGLLLKGLDSELVVSAFASECEWAFLSAIGCRSVLEPPREQVDPLSPQSSFPSSGHTDDLDHFVSRALVSAFTRVDSRPSG